MPYKFDTDKKKIPRDKDRRVKLSEEDRQEIKRLYPYLSQRNLAKMFNVSRRLIIFIGCPEKHELNLKQREERGGWKQYYNKEKWAKQMKKHRRYKRGLELRGLLK